MKLFGKKVKPKTIQELQQEIMDLQFGVLKGFLEQNALKNKLRAMEVDTTKMIQEWEKLTREMNDVKEKIKGEIDETISEGTKSDSTLI